MRTCHMNKEKDTPNGASFFVDSILGIDRYLIKIVFVS